MEKEEKMPVQTEGANNGNTQGCEGKNNYTFNNCSVTINEEGKAIDILQKKQELAEKKTEMTIAMLGAFGEILKTYLNRPASKKQAPKKKPVSKPTAKNKKK